MARLDPVEAAARRAVASTLADLDPGARLVVGVSGGSDSLALAAVTAHVARSEGHELLAVIVDHGLQDDSAAVAERAAEQVRGFGVAAEVDRVVVGADGGPEAAARTARRAALARRDADAVLLGHTLDDQAETVLLGLGRGSGPRSLSGMPAVAPPFRRPFLALTRADTRHLCTLHGLTWWDDPHNADPRFTRARLRHEVLPLLEDVLGGGVAAALARSAELLRPDVELLDALAADAASLDVSRLLELHPALRSRVLRRAALDAGARPDELAAHHVAELVRLVVDYRGQQRVELPGHVSCRRDGDRLAFGPTPS